MNTKQCKKCKELLEVSEFNKQKKNKDGLYSYCRHCSTNYARERRLKNFNKEPYLHLLKASCTKAFERGKPDYNESGYSGISCSYKNINEFFNELWNDELFRAEWIKQTNIFLKTNKMTDRPSLDRIDSKGDYVLHNLKVSPFGMNSYTANVKPCQIFVFDSTSIRGCYEFPSVTDARKSIKSIVNASSSHLKKLDSGNLITLDNGQKILLQSQNGKLKNTDDSQYRIVMNTRYVVYDTETNEELETIGEYQAEYEASGIRLEKVE